VENNKEIKKSIGTNELTPHLILIVIQPFRKEDSVGGLQRDDKSSLK
jgi:hypothetical protein